MNSLLKVEDLKVQIKKNKDVTTIIKDINFSINPGETLGVVGESGCGKSITSLAIMRLLDKNAQVTGKIQFESHDILRMTQKEFRHVRGNHISLIFQEPMTSLNPLHKIGKQISEPVIRHLKMSKSDAKERTIELLNAVGIPRPNEIYNEYPYQLSGGMRQRIVIAMAMACNPRLIIADEPTTALDVTIQAQILKLLKKIAKENGTSILFITHDLGVVAEMCDRVIVMYAGQIVEEADVRTIFKQPKHPYTKGLLSSMPNMEKEYEVLDTIEGSVPMFNEMPTGCRYASRCKLAQDICFNREPDLIKANSDHKARCYFA
ncbi:ABC transporter ATP-binding protein [Terrilactibacillus laevilacticus]|uniref:ABC transporter ATP-binding protein n=1 Tax=Terrilactibacillus laevilacticus TaxID=1380157 RepID=A0ABW5PN79_9BACI|nr:ABC transporter ATP-binding protein [Terrilactibacillus laevilacticus]